MRPGLVVAVRPPPQVLCVAATKLRGEVFVRFGPEAGGPGGVHGSIYEKFHAEVQGLGRAVAAPRLQFETARRAPGVPVRAVRVVMAFCCFVMSLSSMSLKFCCCLLEVGALPSHHDIVTELGLVGAGPLGGETAGWFVGLLVSLRTLAWHSAAFGKLRC